MSSSTNLNVYDADFVDEVQRESEQNLALCYQCGNCTAGCPVSFAYDYPVNQIMRLVQAGRKKEALSSHAIWLCASCETCTTRCPNDIDVARVMDVLRHMARRENLVCEPAVSAFWDAFLGSVEKHGRIFELGLMASYVSKTGRVLTDVDLAPMALRKGKLGFKAHTLKGISEIRGIFDRYREHN
ncbi:MULTISPECIES: 4Fe-4S dicluster domain-containing protein [unclassified Pseudodesulfovibrio]|uniref:4Fe-4S dicluster domain-containing protein n=1 Tax=unclassified Pseudodesulfovibrio TaxID=2661612 RepID=UPI000FEB89DA|nr:MULTISPECIES: 4Fe-4S dicluster domain-containing protein [unclassified Pseudodesulfovibrio]MCJ2165307.1 4Fe-4S dicluster domain-containing protein [Pseudodesulfovibrio sp. S3-i]RWU02467.1 4Fe-4S dicluster domain-containing protein [Pseudodesulfovibrio sp. S3]